MDSESLLKDLQKLSLSHKSTLTTSSSEPDYVVDLSSQISDNLLAIASSNFSIHLLSKDQLKKTCTLKGHTSTITKVEFCKADPHLLYSTSKDKSLRCWDTRTEKQVAKLQAPASVNAELLSLDVGQSGRVLCAGTEKTKFDAYLLFWDSRQRSVLGCYKECFEDDITQVRFQPGSDRYLATGSSDGLVCTFDLKETTEDDSLQITSNTESDVACVGWCGQDFSCVYAVTTDNSVHVWDRLEGDSLCSIEDLEDLKNSQTSSVDYIVDIVPSLTAVDKARSSAVLVAGSFSGDLSMISLDDSGSFASMCSLPGGHSACIRCAYWDDEKRQLITGGEDSMVCLWSVGGPTTSVTPVCSPSSPSKNKLQGKVKAKSSILHSGKKPYDRHRR